MVKSVMGENSMKQRSAAHEAPRTEGATGRRGGRQTCIPATNTVPFSSKAQVPYLRRWVPWRESFPSSYSWYFTDYLQMFSQAFLTLLYYTLYSFNGLMVNKIYSIKDSYAILRENHNRKWTIKIWQICIVEELTSWEPGSHWWLLLQGVGGVEDSQRY